MEMITLTIGWFLIGIVAVFVGILILSMGIGIILSLF